MGAGLQIDIDFYFFVYVVWLLTCRLKARKKISTFYLVQGIKKRPELNGGRTGAGR